MGEGEAEGQNTLQGFQGLTKGTPCDETSRQPEGRRRPGWGTPGADDP